MVPPVDEYNVNMVPPVDEYNVNMYNDDKLKN